MRGAVSAIGPPAAYFSVPSLVAAPVSTFTRRFVPFMPITRRRSATGLKSMVARPPLSKASPSLLTGMARPVMASIVTICPASVSP